ncbi:SDR family oxidoreductase [Modestobacter sp. L9-4]|uniref:SDR family oxidoreductase n=1 Tax=Modestobacter sp. L9-4 TaxID=2851567 RepID=UPI001C74E0D6|nr:SDR family oxidoreductase [Modestobacter sp. L9-4]QXG74918.1 SDR family oxidoreductase [Modestobacter sp. L9-4]
MTGAPGVEGKVVAVTGASSGIGEAIALLLAERGAKVVLGARRADKLADLAGRIEQAGGEAVVAETDVTKREDLVGLVAAGRERWGRFDVLVSNAGAGSVGPITDLDVDGWELMVDVNVKGLLYGVAAALPVFQEQGSGHFVTVLSVAGLQISPGTAVYAATKNAGRTFSEALRQEVGDSIRVTAVSPGMVATDFTQGTKNDEARAQMEESKDEIAIDPSAIARAVAFAIEQPADVDVNEIVVRPTAED